MLNFVTCSRGGLDGQKDAHGCNLFLSCLLTTVNKTIFSLIHIWVKKRFVKSLYLSNYCQWFNEIRVYFKGQNIKIPKYQNNLLTPLYMRENNPTYLKHITKFTPPWAHILHTAKFNFIIYLHHFHHHVDLSSLSIIIIHHLSSSSIIITITIFLHHSSSIFIFHHYHYPTTSITHLHHHPSLCSIYHHHPAQSLSSSSIINQHHPS